MSKKIFEIKPNLDLNALLKTERLKFILCFSDFPEFSFIPNGPGEMGEAVVIPKEKEAESKEQFKINQFNLVASEMIALNRSLPDVRSDK